ncbi:MULTISPECIES: NAD(P)-binding domain-containing protein [unclassified Neorhizobium]|uniref:NAD(P)-binding domain-containing protein n=1 Tax=unclassified Neorhizobium TaxID=2629175 RepID=UPI001FF53DD9|nr:MULTISPECIES: NAD(P)/FAD-dependent oxidoreductase [unclassified Neorhizobium]MCJ9669625.1 NAD(P)/FAD-dependent oxidoreductase [Neorhizobium sp. SHOUNA12B]MCJ9746002.1 NAD(P)/FAD-dependent oxidoreductase [Neorhizobium sp. SHOUNA12A]
MQDRNRPADLEALEARLALDLLWLNQPPKAWVPPRDVEGSRVLDVAVVGAGLCGLVTLAALKKVGISNARAFDRSPQGFEGPWVTYARMETLRTRKDAVGPALGIPSLTFRAWFEAQYGAQAYLDMGLIPRPMWMEYLVWYRRVLGLDVANETAFAGLEFREDGLLALQLETAGQTQKVLARRVVLATGLDGLGAPAQPEVAGRVSPRFVKHGADLIDMTALRGKRVAIVGAGASAMDNAAAALEAGAARVDIFVRRADIPRIDKFTGVGSQGMTHGYLGLPDADKWTYMVAGERAQIPPPRHSVQRVSRHPNAFFHIASPVDDLVEMGDGVEVVTPKGRYAADLVIFATGFSVDFGKRPEFAALRDRILLWQDVYTPPAGWEHAGIGATPYLGPAFEFRPRPDLDTATADAVSRISCFAYPAVPSHGKITSGIPSISEGATRLATGLARSLFVEDRAYHLDRFLGFDTPELLGDEWTDADLEEEMNRANG